MYIIITSLTMLLYLWLKRRRALDTILKNEKGWIKDQWSRLLKNGESVQTNKPILGLEVDKLRKLNPATLKLWGIRFEKSTNVNFQCKIEVANLDATI